MTVSTQTYLIQYNGDGMTTAFATDFEFINDSDLVVVLTASDGTDTTQTITTHYTVAGAGVDAGGTVTMLTAPASGERLTIYRDTTLTQATDYTAFDAFPAESHEQALDKLTLIAQENAVRLNDRVIRFKDSEDRTDSAHVSTVPSPVDGKVLGWDSSGNLANLDLSSASTNTDIDAILASGDKRKKLVVNETEDGYELAGAEVVVAGGTADAITITTGESLAAYNSNEVFRFKASADNTGACTINIDSIGVKDVKLGDGSDPAAGDINSGHIHTVWYDGTNLVLVNPYRVTTDKIIDANVTSAKIAGSAVTTAKIADDAVTKAKILDRCPPGHISGLAVTIGADTEHDLDIATGSARDSSDTIDLILTSAIFKRIDAAWAEGTGNGGFPSAGGSGLTLSANTEYHYFLIAKADGTVDAGWDSNSDASVLLNADNAGGAGYQYYRRIKTINTDSSSNIGNISEPVYSGFVGSDGSTGNDTPQGWSVASGSAGNYTVTCNLGHTNYSVVTTVVDQGGSNIDAKLDLDADSPDGIANNAFYVHTTASGGDAAHDFHFIVHNRNYEAP